MGRRGRRLVLRRKVTGCASEHLGVTSAIVAAITGSYGASAICYEHNETRRTYCRSAGRHVALDLFMESDGIAPNCRIGPMVLELGIRNPPTWEFSAGVFRRAEFSLFLARTFR